MLLEQKFQYFLIKLIVRFYFFFIFFRLCSLYLYFAGWFGRATVVLSWVTIFLGMDLLGVPTQLFVAFAWVLGAYLIAYVWLDVMKIKEIGIRAYLFGAYTKKDDEPQLSDYY